MDHCTIDFERFSCGYDSDMIFLCFEHCLSNCSLYGYFIMNRETFFLRLLIPWLNIKLATKVCNDFSSIRPSINFSGSEDLK